MRWRAARAVLVAGAAATTGPPPGGVAVCVVGFARTFAHRHVHDGLAAAFAAGLGGDYDVFGVVDDGPGDTVKGARTSPPDPSGLAAAAAALRPAAWAAGPRPMENCSGLLPALDQWFKLAACVDLVAAAEAKRGKAYDRVLRVAAPGGTDQRDFTMRGCAHPL